MKIHCTYEDIASSDTNTSPWHNVGMEYIKYRAAWPDWYCEVVLYIMSPILAIMFERAESVCTRC